MKKTGHIILLFTALLFLSAPAMQCCKKYEDGPALSFKSRKERVANCWKVKSCMIDGADSTSLFSDYTQTFTKDGNYSYSNGNITGAGMWAFFESDLQIKLTGMQNQSPVNLVITKLEEDEFWYYFYNNAIRKEFRLIQY